MGDAMRRRGPDGDGFHIQGSVGLAHRRLRIIDLSELAAQPLFNEKGDVCVSYNGEIYNFRELRAELERAGHVFRSKGDTEVIVHAFEEWGTDSFRRFNGMFAFALLDARPREPALYLVRDRFGVKPLFYSVRDGRLAFASELKPLLEVPWIPREVDPRTLLHFLKFSHVPTPLSILSGVEQLAPAHWLRFRAGEAETGRYWDVFEATPRRPELADASEEECLERLDGALRHSVERQLVSDVPVGCFLSGGIDSSLLATTYAALESTRGNPIRTFSIGYKEAEFDETRFARVIADAFGTEHTEVIAEPKDFFELVPEVPTYFDQPLGDPTLLPTLILTRLARGKVTVALSGDGGDELFFGYPHQRALLALGPLALVPHAVRAPLLEAGGRAARTWLPFGRLGRDLRKLSDMLQFEGRAELYQNFVGTLGPLRMDRLAALVATPLEHEPAYLEPLVKRLGHLTAWQRVSQVFLQTFLVDTVLAKTDRAGMAWGLEARVPFLDDELVALSAALPFRFKYRLGSPKHLLRRLLESRLAARGLGTALSRRPKQGFSVPIREWLRGELRYLLDEYLAPARLRREGILAAAPVAALVREHLSGRANHSHLLWSLVSFQMWKERYL
jgi:asparagine synthase (glutamine-hydrolysing)